MVPQLPLSYLSSNLFVLNPYASANRASNRDYAQAGSLVSIQYPTGGRTFFEYESNVVTELRQTNSDPDPAQMQLVASASGGAMDSLSEIVYYQFFPGGYQGIGTASVSATYVELPKGATGVSVNQDIYLSNNPSGGTPRTYFYRLQEGVPAPGGFDTRTQLYPPTPYNGTPNTLDPGNYLLVALSYSPDDRATLLVKLRNLALVPDPYFDRVVGGLRVRRMIDYARSGDSLTTTYGYTRYDSVQQRHFSTGKLFLSPDTCG
ncbi:hypothetical protein ACFQT0_26330 [Hymenobacter humi]|uniref:DUF4397 domain-containing protein n=1 Tax=Hymenobacter humi TaxID=1411620 RepID=A0ABW2UE52_9BACT